MTKTKPPMSDFNDGIEKAINEAINCISDLGAGKGGWAWEEVNDNLRTLLESLTRPTPDRSEARRRSGNHEPKG